MNGTQIATFVFSCLSALLTTTALVTFFIITPHKERKSSEQKAAEKARQDAVEVTEDKMLLKYIKLQNETIIASNRAISDKLDSQSQRLAVVETVVKNSHLSELPERISKLEESVKSAHKRISENMEVKK